MFNCHQIGRAAILSSILFLAFFQPLNAQWSEEGLLLSNLSTSQIYFEPDSSGGVWILYEDYNLGNRRPKVQHIDADGYKLLGPEGMFVMEDTLANGYIYGVQPLPDGGAIAVYDYWTQDGTVDQVWAQRFSSNGLRTFDQPGIKMSSGHTWDTFRGFYNGTNVCGDGSDGVWVVFTRAFSFDLYYAGMNGDGTLKKEEQQFITTMDVDYGAICEDDRGGFYVVTNCPLNDIYESAFYNHFDSEGTPVYDGRGRRLFSALTYSITKVGALPYGDGGIIVAGGSADGIAWYQRVAPNDTLIWGSTGVHYQLDAVRFSLLPAIKSDGSMIFAGVAGSAYDYRVRFGWISAAGEELVPFAGNIIKHGDASVNHSWPLIAVVQSDGVDIPIIILERDRALELDSLDYYYSVHRISDDGASDLWANTPPEVGGLHPSYLYNGYSSLKLSDNTLLFWVNYEVKNGWIPRYHLYKIDPVELQLGVGEGSPANSFLPGIIEIVSAYPNPFNSSVALAINLPVRGEFTVEVFDITGRRVDTIQQSAAQAGTSKIIWSPGSTLSSGIYFIRAKQENRMSRVQKALLIR